MRFKVCGVSAVLLLACGGPTALTPPGTAENKAPQEVVLAVNVVGDGTVRATGLECRASCTQRFAKGTRLSLRADADAGATFAGWSGSCTGQACELSLDADAALTARFDRPPPPPVRHQLTVRVDGRGTVRSAPAGIDCGASCAASFDAPAQVALMAAPDAGYVFSGWDGSCIGAGGCTVAMSDDAHVIAKFAALPPQMFAVTVSVSGNGKVAGGGLDCPGSSCTLQVAAGTKLALTQAPLKGARFMSWGGACAQQAATCSLTVSQNTAVSAAFQDEVMLLVGADGTNYNDLAINSTHVFYWRYGNNVYGVWRVPKAGGAAELVTSNFCCFNYLVADDSYVYWSNWSGVYRAPASGGRAQFLYSGVNVRNLALDGDQIFWTSLTSYAGPNGGVYTGPAAGGAARALVFANPTGGIAVDPQSVFWTDAGAIWRVPRAGGAAEQIIACGSCSPQVVKVDSENIYYRNIDGDTWARPRAGGEGRRLNTGNPANNMVFQPIELDVHSKIAYWTWHDNSGSTLQGLFRANADGTGFAALDSGTDPFWYGPRVDDNYLFYFHAGALYRRLK